MKWIDRYQRVAVAVLASTLVGIGGCIESTVETTLNPDGSGLRSEKMVISNSDEIEYEMSASQFEYLMGVRGTGWSHAREVEGDDTVDVLKREAPVRNLASWEDVSGSIHIRGATTVTADTRVGRIELGGVQFLNSVKVETGSVLGKTSYTYRETFHWDNLLDAIVESYLGFVREAVEERYPELSSEQTGEIVAFTRGQIWALIDQGLLDKGGEEEERMLSIFIDRTATQTMEIARHSYPDADEESFRNFLRRLVDDDDERLSDFIDGQLPGVNLATSTEIIFRLKMPGRVTATNADEREEGMLIWKFGPGDALVDPVELFAESVIEDGSEP
jgi:hypothetical protein